MDTYVLNYVGDSLCKASNFLGLYTLSTLEDLNVLKTSILSNIQNSINQDFLVSGTFLNGQWLSLDRTPIISEVMPSNAVEGSCAVLSFDGTNFELKSVLCSRSKIVCGYSSSAPPPTYETTASTTVATSYPDLHLCEEYSTFYPEDVAFRGLLNIKSLKNELRNIFLYSWMHHEHFTVI